MANENFRTQAGVSNVRSPGATQRAFDSFSPGTVDQTAGSGFEALANALGLAQKIGAQYGQEYMEDEARKGAEAFTLGILEDGSKINRGELSKTQSKYFMRGFQMAEGQAAALDFGRKLEQEWQSNPEVYNSTDPGAFSTFMQERLKTAIAAQESSNPDFRAGWTKVAPQVYESLRNKQVARVEQLFEEKAYAQTDTAVAGIVSQFGTDVVAMKNALEEYAQEANATGRLPFKKTNEIVADRMITLALETKNPQLLDAIPEKMRDHNQNARIASAKTQVANAIAADENRKRAEYERSMSIARDSFADALVRGDTEALKTHAATIVSQPGGLAWVTNMQTQYANAAAREEERRLNRRFNDPSWVDANARVKAQLQADLQKAVFSADPEKALEDVRTKAARMWSEDGVLLQEDYAKLSGSSMNIAKIAKKMDTVFNVPEYKNAERSINAFQPIATGRTALDVGQYNAEMDAKRAALKRELEDTVKEHVLFHVQSDPSILDNRIRLQELLRPVIDQFRNENLSQPSEEAPVNTKGALNKASEANTDPLKAWLNKNTQTTP